MKLAIGNRERGRDSIFGSRVMNAKHQPVRLVTYGVTEKDDVAISRRTFTRSLTRLMFVSSSWETLVIWYRVVFHGSSLLFSPRSRAGESQFFVPFFIARHFIGLGFTVGKVLIRKSFHHFLVEITHFIFRVINPRGTCFSTNL